MLDRSVAIALKHYRFTLIFVEDDLILERAAILRRTMVGSALWRLSRRGYRTKT